MKYIGFIKEHNSINEAISLKNIVESNNNNDALLLPRIIEYLQSGVLVLAWMGYFVDLRNGKLIEPDSYYSDGTWIWPAYFPYYLKDIPNYPINDEFLSYLKTKNFTIEGSQSLNLKAIEMELSIKLNSLS